MNLTDCARIQAAIQAIPEDRLPIFLVFHDGEGRELYKTIKAKEPWVQELPDAQRDALIALWERSGYTLHEFLMRCYPPSHLHPEVGVRDFHGMFVGVEPDGYTHS